jgi:hypothetical protein
VDRIWRKLKISVWPRRSQLGELWISPLLVVQWVRDRPCLVSSKPPYVPFYPLRITTDVQIILAEVFFQKGMPLQGWLLAGTAPRLIKSLELGNRNHGFKRYKEPMLPPPKTAIEREERIATVWMAHIQDSGFALNSYWSQSMDWRELKCGLPTSTVEFRKKVYSSGVSWVKLTNRIQRRCWRTHKLHSHRTSSPSKSAD